MRKEEMTPSESEWQIMEVFWANSDSLTSKEVIRRLEKEMTPKMVRVLINRLCEKGMLSYTVDTEDKRVYHYSVLKSREECQKEKSGKFVESYFKGNRTNAVAALLQSARLTEEQIKELEEILEKSKGKGGD